MPPVLQQLNPQDASPGEEANLSSQALCGTWPYLHSNGQNRNGASGPAFEVGALQGKAPGSERTDLRSARASFTDCEDEAQVADVGYLTCQA